MAFYKDGENYYLNGLVGEGTIKSGAAIDAYMLNLKNYQTLCNMYRLGTVFCASVVVCEFVYWVILYVNELPSSETLLLFLLAIVMSSYICILGRTMLLPKKSVVYGDCSVVPDGSKNFYAFFASFSLSMALLMILMSWGRSYSATTILLSLIFAAVTVASSIRFFKYRDYSM